MTKNHLRGTSVGVADMMEAREHRQATQQALLAGYGVTLVSFTLNIMGAVKTFPWACITFAQGCQAVETALQPFALLHKTIWRHPTGNEGFFLVDAPLTQVKAAMVALEEAHPLGRLWDVDVLDATGQKCGRSDVGYGQRRCLLCDQPAFVCSRSRAHTLDELLGTTIAMMQAYFQESYPFVVSQCAEEALLYEVSVTPKPGLVDLRNNGAHTDMTVATFEQSAHALTPYFASFVTLGMEATDLTVLFVQARTLGKEAEWAMFQATHGVNTHKGTIFLMGILCCALGYLQGQRRLVTHESLQETIRTMTQCLADDFATLPQKEVLTHGEAQYVHHAMGGARGEAMAGLPHLFTLGLPVFEDYLRQGCSLNDAGVLTLLHLVATMDDTNAIARAGLDGATQAKAQCKALLQTPELLNQDTHALVQKVDDAFIAQNISPGGCADLLALTHFLWQIQGL